MFRLIRKPFPVLFVALSLVLLCAVPAFAQSEEESFFDEIGNFWQFLTQGAGSADALNSPTLLDQLEQFDTVASTRIDDGGFVLGDPDAPITIVEFADWACSFCQTYHPTMQAIVQDYVLTGQVRYELRVYPTAGGEDTVYAGRVAECADEQQPGAFWKLNTLFYALAETEGTPYPNGWEARVSEVLALDTDDLRACADALADDGQVQTDRALGQANGIQGTPAIRVRLPDDTLVPITWDNRTYNSGGVPEDVLRAFIEGGGVLETPVDA